MSNPEPTITTVDLQPCPFCGGLPSYQDVSISDEDWPGANGDWWLAGCASCGIWLPQTEYASKNQAAEAWNKRTELATLRAWVVELEKDKARLDWLDGYKTGDFETPYWKIYARHPDFDLREALDAAMKP